MINNPNEIDIFWPGSKENFHKLLMELYQKIGFSSIGSSRAMIKIYDLGHPNRGFTTFPRTIRLSGLEDCEYDESNIKGYPEFGVSGTIGLKASIRAPTLLEQLYNIINLYLNSDEKLHAEWHKNHLAALQDASKESVGIEVKLELVATVAEKPQYSLESYSLT